MTPTPTSETTDRGDRAGNRALPTQVVAPALAAMVGIAVVVGTDRFLGRRGFLHERPPDWTVLSTGRSALLALASALAVLAARRSVRSWPLVDSRISSGRSLAAATIGLGCAITAAVRVVVDPASLTVLTEEDGVVEWVSAVMAFGAAAMFGLAMVAGRGLAVAGHPPLRRRGLVILAALCGFCFLAGMEEVSWFQRVLDLESPEVVQGRNQPEFNLHNEATDLSENIYYGVGFVVLVLIPGLLGDRGFPSGLADLESVVPSPAVMFGAIASTAVVYEMWEVVPIQVMFFAGLVTVAMYARRQTGPESILAQVTVVALVVVAVFFLGFGHRMTRSWDDTEVRELLLPFGFLLYGWEVFARISARSSSR